jgi:exopolysaccharide biosynthesis polyprenyl glycosylphosphotransferase
MRWPRWVRSRFAERIAIAGHGPAIDVLHEEIRRRRIPGLELVGFLDDPAHRSDERRNLGAPEDMADIVKQHGIHRVVLDRRLSVPDATLLAVRLAGVKLIDDASFYEQLSGRVAVEEISSPELFITMGAGSTPLSALIKRLADILLATLGLALALPVFLIVPPLILLDSRGPIFYRQKRVGAGGHEFMISKFRSMRADAESGSGPVWAVSDDDRVTRVGRWLRKLRLDEVPQLWSVLRNDMSLIGPRPERPYFVNELDGEIPHYGQRHIVKPGVTGWAQINHTYGNTTADALIKLQYDLYYIKNRSFALDVAILLRTVKVVVLQQGAV